MQFVCHSFNKPIYIQEYKLNINSRHSIGSLLNAISLVVNTDSWQIKLTLI